MNMTLVKFTNKKSRMQNMIIGRNYGKQEQKHEAGLEIILLKTYVTLSDECDASGSSLITQLSTSLITQLSTELTSLLDSIKHLTAQYLQINKSQIAKS